MYTAGGVGGGRTLYHLYRRQVQHTVKRWTQSHLRFCQNGESKRSNNSENRGHLDKKKKNGENLFNMLQKSVKW